VAQADSVHIGLKINYETAMSHVEKSDYYILNSLFEVGSLYPDSQILISGHTDIVGSFETNVELSKGRAEILKGLLVQIGVDPKRIETKWFSYDAPIASNDTEEGRAQNRRVVATVYGLDRQQADQLALAAEETPGFYVIKVENEQVTDYVAETLEQSLPEKTVEAQKASIVEKEVLPTVEVVEVEKLKVEEIKKPSRNRYSFIAGIYQNRLAIDSKTAGPSAEWLSNFNSNLEVNYQRQIQKLWVGFKLGTHIQSYRRDDNPSYTWVASQPVLLKSGLTTDYELSRFAFGVDLTFNQEVFWDEVSTIVELKELFVFGVMGRLKYKMTQRKNWDSNLGLNIELPFFPTSDSINPKGQIGYMANFEFIRKLKSDNKFLFQFNFGLRNFSSDRMDQQESAIGLNFGYQSDRWF
jgi:coenzyme F420-reducing hydrogenase delta subunit